MATDGITISAITKELSDKLTGARIYKIAQPEPDLLILTIKASDMSYKLLISANASIPLIHLTETTRTAPLTAPNFCMVLRKHIQNGRIIGIHQPGLERCIHIDIEHYNEMGDLCTLTLISEIMGKHSNIILCNENNTIIDSIKHISFAVSSVREVLPGKTYFLPDTMSKLDPLSMTKECFENSIISKACEIRKALYTSLTGISPVIAQEICFNCGLDSELPVNSLSDDMLSALFDHICTLITMINEGAFSPCIYFENNIPKEFSVIDLAIYKDLNIKEYSSVSKCMEDYFAQKEQANRIRHKSTDLRHIVSIHLERAVRKLDLQLAQLKDTEKRDKYRIYGELLNTYGYNIDTGSDSAEVLNYYTNETVVIPLAKDLTPLENAQKYFEKYQKLKRTFEALSVQIEESRKEVDYLKSVNAGIEMSENESDLSDIREELREAGYLQFHKNTKKTNSKSTPLHYVSSDGYDIYVGKNNIQNDYLSHKFAAGNDWWFHVKKYPGSHVIVKTNGDEIPDNTFEEAARLAAHYSTAGNSDKIEIDYVQKKHLKKPAGSPPGYVIYHTNYSMVASTDIDGIKIYNS